MKRLISQTSPSSVDSKSIIFGQQKFFFVCGAQNCLYSFILFPYPLLTRSLTFLSVYVHVFINIYASSKKNQSIPVRHREVNPDENDGHGVFFSLEFKSLQTPTLIIHIFFTS